MLGGLGIKRFGPPPPESECVNLREVVLQPVAVPEEARFQALMDAHHYLGALPKIGHTRWYVATWQDQWLARLSFSAAAWKCAARDAWIGWDFRHQYDRLHLIANNSRFLILPAHHDPNLASRVLALCERRLAADWQERFGYPLLLLETFVDPRHFHGTIYRAANWCYVGDTRGFRRTRAGYSGAPGAAKRVFVRSLHAQAQARLSRPVLDPQYLNDYLNFPGVGQAFGIARHTVTKKTGKTSTETVYGVTSHTQATAPPADVLAFNRGHWSVENGCHYTLDWNWDEDRCTIRTGHGPANITAPRRFAIGAIKAKSHDTVAATIQRLARNVRLVFDYLRMTENSRRRPRPFPALAG